jgi:glyoxylase-like metal-dependent hydrolase (beta-lactamase superfamily II)
MFGFGNLVKLTKIFTNKPIEGVAITHNHIDHIGGMFHFDKVYMNKLDWKEYDQFSDNEARYADDLPTRRFELDFEFKPEDYAKNVPINLVAFEDGDIIDVGGASIQAIWTPGHSAGMTSILFRELGFLMTGDEVNHNTLIANYPIESYRRVVQNLLVRQQAGEFTKIFISHGESDTEAPSTVLAEMVEICDGIIDGSIPGVPYFGPVLKRAYPALPNQLRADGGFTNVVYNPSLIHDVGFVTEGSDTYYKIMGDTVLKGDYVKEQGKPDEFGNPDTIWYFSKDDGRGIRVRYQYLAPELIQLFSYGYNTCYLLIGTEKALWVDSMFGFGNLVKLTKYFTDKPIDGVAITHKDIDHIGGMFHFNKVYMNKIDWLAWDSFKSAEDRWADDKPTRRKELGYGDFSVADYAKNVPIKLVDLADGQIIDLGGGISVEAIHTPGHTAGFMSFLFKPYGYLLVGDECNHNTLMGALTVQSYQQVIQGLLDRQNAGDWNRVFISHGETETEAPITMFQEMIDICDMIMNDPAWVGTPYNGNPNRLRAYPTLPNQMRSDGGFTNLVFSVGNVFD